MTRKERETLCEVSLNLYGRKYAWQKMVRKGEFKYEDETTANGTKRTVRRWVPLSVEDVVLKMEKAVQEQKEAALKAAEEAVKQAQGEENGKKTEEQGQEVSTQEASSQEG